MVSRPKVVYIDVVKRLDASTLNFGLKKILFLLGKVKEGQGGQRQWEYRRIILVSVRNYSFCSLHIYWQLYQLFVHYRYQIVQTSASG